SPAQAPIRQKSRFCVQITSRTAPITERPSNFLFAENFRSKSKPSSYISFRPGAFTQPRAAHVCANCKPAFVQKLAEGAQINPNDLRFAGFWTRFAAVFLDGLILWVVGFTLQLAFGLTAAQALGQQS